MCQLHGVKHFKILNMVYRSLILKLVVGEILVFSQDHISSRIVWWTDSKIKWVYIIKLETLSCIQAYHVTFAVVAIINFRWWSLIFNWSVASVMRYQPHTMYWPGLLSCKLYCPDFNVLSNCTTLFWPLELVQSKYRYAFDLLFYTKPLAVSSNWICRMSTM